MSEASLQKQLTIALTCAESLLEAAASNAKQLRELKEIVETRRVVEARADAGTPAITDSQATHVGFQSSETDQQHGTCVGLAETFAGPVDYGILHKALSLATPTFITKKSNSKELIFDDDAPTIHGAAISSGGGCLARCIWMPTAPSRIAWDIASLSFIAWDLLVLPLVVFDIEELPLFIVVGWASSLFWITDLVLNFFVAFHRQDGLIETRLRHIARRYLSSWFAIDLTTIVVDVASRLFFVGAGALGRFGKAWRAIRIMKVVRMMRLARAAKFVIYIDNLLETMVSKSMVVGVTILRLLGEVAVAVHFIACAWYAVGSAHGDGHGWVQPFDPNDKGYLYILSFHWSIAQFTPAPNNVHATNFAERLFATVVLFFGLVLFSSLIGRVTALVTKRQQERVEQMKDMERLRSLCTTRLVSLPISNRLLHSAKRGSRVTTWVLEEDVACLSKVPRSLLFDLRCEMYTRALSAHPLFRMPQEVMRSLVMHLCEHVVKEVRVTSDEVLFRSNEVASEMHIVVHGQCDYTKTKESTAKRVKQSKTDASSLGPGTCLCEGALWMSWERRGFASVPTMCSVVVLSAELFRAVATRRPPAMNVLRRYARHFVSRLSEASSESEVDDTWAPTGEEEDLPAVLLQNPPAITDSNADGVTERVSIEPLAGRARCEEGGGPIFGPAAATAAWPTSASGSPIHLPGG
eukprot:CAMPEP_0176041418 /NCGR_PEP_ID=MMETSP0120_2-20121206/20543_1 /TAXON_ID=160619 /ORGANISM="Kryptoperidinium foliaceum, Strain CCMP 1326" /LENGTH=693 /DNA_ID=CAMNT_0017374819 /DNA_START=70 /DNA_END=2149 /DNA_ORIENTATION=+